jgi:hypothetical protein
MFREFSKRRSNVWPGGALMQIMEQCAQPGKTVREKTSATLAGYSKARSRT